MGAEVMVRALIVFIGRVWGGRCRGGIPCIYFNDEWSIINDEFPFQILIPVLSLPPNSPQPVLLRRGRKPKVLVPSCLLLRGGSRRISSLVLLTAPRRKPKSFCPPLRRLRLNQSLLLAVALAAEKNMYEFRDLLNFSWKPMISEILLTLLCCKISAQKNTA